VTNYAKIEKTQNQIQTSTGVIFSLDVKLSKQILKEIHYDANDTSSLQQINAQI